MSKERETNIEFLTRVMDFSRNGGLMQAFVLDALQKQAKKLAETPIEDLRTAFGENCFVSADAWQACAIEFNEELKKFHG